MASRNCRTPREPEARHLPIDAHTVAHIVAATADGIAAAAARLRGGGLLAVPTETVYGLGADSRNGLAVAAIFAAKGRPRFNPLIVHVATVDDVHGLAVMTPAARALAEAFWPGPLTLVMARAASCPVSELATAGLATIAIRVPAHPVARALLTISGVPVAAPSANRSGHVSPTTAGHVAADLADRDVMILDGGPASIGLESTVVDVSGDQPVILRLGGLARTAISSVIGRPVALATGAPNQPASPGMLARHYAPATPLRLGALSPEPGEAWLGFGQAHVDHAHVDHAGPNFNLSAAGDPAEAAANLFAALRRLDAAGCVRIAVAPIPSTGLGEAINDRLRRAALGRD